jgi:hypothetical protein
MSPLLGSIPLIAEKIFLLDSGLESFSNSSLKKAEGIEKTI